MCAARHVPVPARDRPNAALHERQHERIRRGPRLRPSCRRRSTDRAIDAQVHVERAGHALHDALDAALIKDRGEAAHQPAAGPLDALVGRSRRPASSAWPRRPPSTARCRCTCPDGSTGPPPISDIRSRRPATAEITNPFAIALAKVVRSGSTPKTDCAPPGATRNPDTISSKIRTTSCRRVISRRPVEVARRWP